MPYQGCAACRDALLATAVAVASPVVGLNLAVDHHQPAVLRLILLALALATQPDAAGAGRGNLAGCLGGGGLGHRPGRRV